MSVELDNGPSGYAEDGDSIGVVEKWEAPEMETTQMRQSKRSRTRSPRAAGAEDVRAAMWAGKGIAQVLNYDPDSDKQMIKDLLKKLFKEGHITTVTGETSDRKPAIFVVPREGTAASGETKTPNEAAAVCEGCGESLRACGRMRGFVPINADKKPFETRIGPPVFGSKTS